MKRRAQALFKKLWPMFTKAYELVLLAYNVGYLFDKTPYYRPWLHWLGIDIRRMDQEDYVRSLQPRCQSICSQLSCLIDFVNRSPLDRDGPTRRKKVSEHPYLPRLARKDGSLGWCRSSCEPFD